MKRGISDPSWKKGPKGPTHSHSEHEIYAEDYVYDIDGPSVAQAERYHSPVVVDVIEGAECMREGCHTR